MNDFSEKHFSIDAGAGEKMEGCPYSLYEDGHDVKEYIIAPKGYKFVGFKCVMAPENRIYDGKLIAQYEKEPLKNRIIENLKYIVLGAIAVVIIAVVIILAANSSGKTKNSEDGTTKQATETIIEITEDAVQETADSITEIVTTEETIQDAVEEVAAPITAPVAAATPDELFRQEFWGLIHEGTLQMDPYKELYDKYKSQGVSGEEFEYLRLTILKDWVTFKEWYGKLRKISKNDLAKIETINELISKLNEQ